MPDTVFSCWLPGETQEGFSAWLLQMPCYTSDSGPPQVMLQEPKLPRLLRDPISSFNRQEKFPLPSSSTAMIHGRKLTLGLEWVFYSWGFPASFPQRAKCSVQLWLCPSRLGTGWWVEGKQRPGGGKGRDQASIPAAFHVEVLSQMCAPTDTLNPYSNLSQGDI